MKTTALIAAAALACGTAAFAQQQQDKSVRGEESARIEQQDHGTAGQKMRNAMHKLGEKTRHAFHRAGDKTRQRSRHQRRARSRQFGFELQGRVERVNLNAFDIRNRPGVEPTDNSHQRHAGFPFTTGDRGLDG